MKRAKVRRYAAAVLALVLLVLAPVGAQVTAASDTAKEAENAAGVSKEEIIYVALGHDGSAGKAYVINAFEVSKPGKLTDYGSYTSVVNLTTKDPLSFTDGKVSFSAPSGRFYYQGNLDSITLPWVFDVSYYLDGEKTTAKDIAGASGRVEVRLSIRENPNADENAKRFASRYALQTQITLDASRCFDISAKGAAIATAGKNKLISYIKLPGLDADYSVSMDAVDFEMAGIQMSGVPLTLDIDFDADELAGGFDKLTQGADDLAGGVRTVNDGAMALSEGAASLSEGLKTMRNGIDELLQGLEALSEGNTSLLEGSQGICEALSELNERLESFEASSADLTELVEGSAAAYQAIGAIADGLAGLKAGLDEAGALGLWQSNEAAVALLNAQIEALKADPVGNAAQIEQLTALSQLIAANDALLRGLLAGICGDGTDANPGLAAAANALKAQYGELDDAIKGLPDMLSELIESLAGLKDAIGLIVQNYGELHGGFSESVAGTDELLGGYRRLCEGFSELVDGALSLSGGMSGLVEGLGGLSDGAGQLSKGVGSIEPMMRERIDELLEPFKADKKGVGSFVSTKNINIAGVQFVMTTAAVEKEEPEKPPVENVKKSFWQRLLALFGL